MLADGSTAVEGTVEEVEAPHRLVTTWRVLYDAAMAAEPPSRVEWRLEPAGDGLTKLTAVHRDLGRSPLTSASVGTGWTVGPRQPEVASLETGEGLPPATIEAVASASTTPTASRTADSGSRRTTRRGSCSAAATSMRTRPRT